MEEQSWVEELDHARQRLACQLGRNRGKEKLPVK